MSFIDKKQRKKIKVVDTYWTQNMERSHAVTALFWPKNTILLMLLVINSSCHSSILCEKKNQFNAAFHRGKVKEHVFLCKRYIIDNIIVSVNNGSCWIK